MLYEAFSKGVRECSGKHGVIMFYVLGEKCDNLFWASYIYQKLQSMKPHYFLQSGYIRMVFDHDDIVFSNTINLSL